MAGIVVLTLTIVCSLSYIEAISTKVAARRDGQGTTDAVDSCVPGSLFQGRGCSRCFCNADGKQLCGPQGTCTMADKVPKLYELIHIYNREKLLSLTNMENQAASCSPGQSYRIDCNRCICLETKSLVCEELLCPNYDEVNLQTAKELTGKPCTEDDAISKECVKCMCNNGTTACEVKDGCIPAQALEFLGTKPSKFRCMPGQTYENPNGGLKCWCTIHGEIYCPQNFGDKALTKKFKERKIHNSYNYHRTPCPRRRTTTERQYDNRFLDPDDPTKFLRCTPGKRYRDECNRCICSAHGVLRCSSIRCLKGPKAGFLPFRNKHRRTTRKPKLAEQPFNKAFLSGTKKCSPGVVYRDGCNKCVCDKGSVLKCTSKLCLKGRNWKPVGKPVAKGDEQPFDPIFDRNPKKCTPGVVYRKECNKCTCTKDRDLFCTSMGCPDSKEVAKLKKLRLKLQKDY